MSKWTWKTWLMAGIIGALFVTAGVLVAVGVATHTEPGLSNPDARWDHTPLTVACHPYAGEEPDVCDVARGAVEVVNGRLGFAMLEWRGRHVGHSDIEVTMRAPVEVGSDGPCGAPGECFELEGSAGTYDSCAVRTMNVSGAGDLEWLVAYHGLGHCLGLAHDDYEQSIMRPVQRPTPDRTIPPWISDFDRRLLRDLYAPR